MTPVATQVVDWLRDARGVTVLTGAGISTDSGIPDFRGPNGLWTRNPQAARMSSLQDYLADPEVRRRAWAARKVHPAWTAEPNDGHRALADLEKGGRLVAIITQNIDELHQRAGSSRDKVIEVHGTIHQVECLTCGVRTPMADELAGSPTTSPTPHARFAGASSSRRPSPSGRRSTPMCSTPPRGRRPSATSFSPSGRR